MKILENAALINASVHPVTTPKAKQAERQKWIVVLCAIVAMLVLSGCATTRLTSSADPLQFNPLTGYPAVGRFDETGW